jgi:class 3 adenylate cyclase
MFCDLVDSTSLAAQLDAEDWRNLVNAYLDEASAAVTGLGGHVLKRLGDGLMASVILKRKRTTPSARCGPRSPSNAPLAMERISISWSPARTISPAALPIKARATGETYAIDPFRGSASSSPTILKAWRLPSSRLNVTR